MCGAKSSLVLCAVLTLAPLVVAAFPSASPEGGNPPTRDAGRSGGYSAARTAAQTGVGRSRVAKERAAAAAVPHRPASMSAPHGTGRPAGRRTVQTVKLPRLNRASPPGSTAARAWGPSAAGANVGAALPASRHPAPPPPYWKAVTRGGPAAARTGSGPGIGRAALRRRL